MPLVHSSGVFLAEFAGLLGANPASVKWSSAAFARFAHAAAPAAVAALWQGALVALALVLCLRFVVRVSAAHRFAAWAAGFAIAAALPLLPLLERSGAAIAAAPLGGAAATPWLQNPWLDKPWLVLDSRWGFAIAAIWLAASAFRAVGLALNLLRLRGLWRAAAPVETEMNLRSPLAAASPARPIQICTTRDLDRPSVIGFLSPRILIPEWLYARLTPGELEQVVLHEAEHLRRRDDWTNLLQKLSLVVFPLNPALAWMERRLCREREMACDEGVVRRTQAPRAYAACLTTLAERGLQRRESQRREYLRRAQALSLGAFDRRPELVHRVQCILRRKQAIHPLAACALVGVIGCGLVVGALELSRSPQLVAFVAAPRPDAQTAALAPPQAGTPGVVRASYARTSEPSLTATDAVFHPSERFRAIDTKAILPATRNAALTPVAAPSHRGNNSSPRVTETAMTGAGSAPREVPANAATPTPAETAAQTQEFLVLTAWEEVETSLPQTSPSTTRTIADYETGANTQGQNDVETGTTRAAEITFTRLILVVYPASAGPASAATAAQPAPATGSHSHRPALSYSGWLFFQL